MKEAVDKTGEGQAKEILDSLESRASSTEGRVYQSYDYTASMSGVYKGAQQCLQDKVGQSVPYIPCQSHRYLSLLKIFQIICLKHILCTCHLRNTHCVHAIA